MVKKIYRKLTKDQIERGVFFSSTLSKSTVEQFDDTTISTAARNYRVVTNTIRWWPPFNALSGSVYHRLHLQKRERS